MLFRRRAEEEFNVNTINSPEMDALIQRCADIYRGKPYWLDPDAGIKTINFAKSVCSEVARLTTLAIHVTIDGSARATWLQDQIDKIYFDIRHWVEFGCGYGTVIIKPNGKTFDVFTPFDFAITECDKDDISGVVFKDSYQDGDTYYTRLEYHRFVSSTVDGVEVSPYYISNKTYVSDSEDELGKPIEMSKTKWADMLEETPPILKVNGEKIDAPMFGVLRMPTANHVDMDSPLGLPIFMDAIEEFKDLDVAYSRNAREIFDSEKIILIDDRLTVESGSRIAGVKLPHYAKNVFGSGANEFYQEINPQLNTDVRLTGFNAILSQIGYKCGFSNGYFVFNEKTGMATATQVESEDRRTIQLIKDVRDKLEDALNGAIYALSLYADLYEFAPAGEYEITYDFGDITYDLETDRARWWNYVTQGKVPAWVYFTKFEGLSEQEAKAMVDEAQVNTAQGLFDEE